MPGEPLNVTMLGIGLAALAAIVFDLIYCVTTVHRKFSDKEVDNRLTDLERNIEQMRNMFTMEEITSESEPLATSDIYDEQPPEDEITAPSATPEDEIAAPSVTPESDRHAALKRLLLNKEVHLTYKKQTFVAKITHKAEAPHGYLIVCGKDEYNTPSHFSYAKKSTVNPNIHSDNGWDSIYVITGTNAKGKQTKLSLKEFIAASVQG